MLTAPVGKSIGIGVTMRGMGSFTVRMFVAVL